MTLAETIYEHSKKLPEAAAREVLDFIEFLEQRYAARPEEPPVTDEERRKAALERIASARLHWGGKPIEDRESLYERGND